MNFDRHLRPWLLLLLLIPSPSVLAAEITVQVARVEAGAAQTKVSALGEVRSRAAVTLVAPVTGRLLGPLRADGPVRQGALLGRIQVAGLPARVAAAQEQQDYAKNALQRAQKLFDDGIIAREQVDAARLAARQAGDALSALQQESAQLQITAPVAGLLQYLVPVGTLLAAGTPIARIEGRGKPWIQALVPPQVAGTLFAGDTVQIKVMGRKLAGRVRSVGQSARQSGLVAVLINLPKQSNLLPGEWVELHLPVVLSHPARFAVPAQAVVMRGAEVYVWRVDQGRAQAVPVQIVARTENRVLIRGALQCGQVVVTRGNTRLSPGVAVAVQP